MAPNSVAKVTTLIQRLWIFSILLCCVPLYGIDRDRRLADLYHTAWTFKDGAPSEIHALAQTSDGFLWLGTASGLFRFDGIRFEEYQAAPGQEYRQKNVFSLFAAPDGGLWVGYWYGGASLIQGGKIRNYGTADGLSHVVYAFARDRRGTIWAATTDGLARLEGGRWKQLEADRGFTGPAVSLFVDRQGTLWVGTPNRLAYLTEHSARFETAAENLQVVMKVAESPNGTLWMAETMRGVRIMSRPGRNQPSPFAEIEIGSQAITFDDQGSLWIASLGDGIARIPFPERLGPKRIKRTDAGIEHLTQENGLTANYVYCVLRDQEGNLWFGTSGGLDQFRQGAIVSQSLIDGSFVHALAPGSAGALWVASVGTSRLSHIRSGTVDFSLFIVYLDSAYVDRYGYIWLAHPGSPPTPGHIIRLDDKGRHPAGSIRPGIAYGYHAFRPDGANPKTARSLDFRSVDLPGPISRVRAMTSDASGRLWISTNGDTCRLDKSGWTLLRSLGGPSGSATAEFTDSEDRVWFGFNNTVVMLQGDKATMFSSAEGVKGGTVQAIAEEGSNIWIGGDSGLQYFDGSRFQSVEAEDGEALNGISGMVPDPGKGLWIYTSQGAAFIADRDLQRAHSPGHRVAIRVFGLLDGLKAAPTAAAVPPIARTSDGLIWFATTKGLASIDPERVPSNTIAPPVVVKSLIADGNQFDLSNSTRLPARTNRVEISYTAPSLTMPERIRFRYRLDGLEKEWQDPGTRRVAVYTNLGPGPYTFHLIACNNDGVWNETGASLNFSIAPTFYQTNWFRALYVVFFLALLWAAYQLRVRRLLRQFAIGLEARVNERTRIARDLHDTLLQTLHGLMFQFQAVRNLMPRRPDDAIRSLDEAISDTKKALAESRNAIQDLRSEPIAECEFPEMLIAESRELACAKTGDRQPPKFELTEEGERRTLSPTAQDEICRIALEILRNAYRHAEAQGIEAEVRYGDQMLRFRIRDDGKGIDPPVLNAGGRAGHWGIRGVRERAERIGARIDFWSEVGAGTEVEVEVPASIAYQKESRNKAWSRLLRKVRNRAQRSKPDSNPYRG